MTIQVFNIENMEGMKNYPFINMRTTDTDIEYKMPTPGVIEESFNLVIHNECLHVTFDVDDTIKWLNKGQYKHSIPTKGVAVDGITCDYDKGVLNINMPLKKR